MDLPEIGVVLRLEQSQVFSFAYNEATASLNHFLDDASLHISSAFRLIRMMNLAVRQPVVFNQSTVDTSLTHVVLLAATPKDSIFIGKCEHHFCKKSWCFGEKILLPDNAGL